MADIKSKLVLDNAQFNKRAKASKVAIGGLAGGLKLMGGAAKLAAVGISAATVGLTAIIATTSSAIDRLGKVAKTTGFAAETLQKFQFAAEQSGVGADQAAVALRRFSRRLGEAQKGTGELLPALKKLGIDTRDSTGNLKTGEQILFEFADGLAKTENASERLALAFKAFDSEGAELVEVLKNGSAGLNEFFTEADRLGFVLSTSAIQGVEKFNDEFNKLQRIISGITRQFVSALAPALRDVTTQLSDFLVTFIEEKGGPEALGAFFKDKFIDIIVQVIKAVEMLSNVFIELANGLAGLMRKFGDDPFFGLGESAEKNRKQIELLQKVARDQPSGFGFQSPDEFREFFNTLDKGNPIIKEYIRQMEAYFDAIAGKGTPIAEAKSNLIIDDLIEGMIEGSKIQNVDFSEFIENLLGYKEGDAKPTGEKIGDDLMEGMVVTGKAGKSFFIALLDKIYGEEGQARVDQFMTDFFDEAENMLDKVKGFMKLIFGPELVESIKNAFLASDVGDFVKTMAEGLVKGVQMFEDSLADAIVNGKADFSALADHLKQVLAKAMVQKFITGPIMGLFGLAKGGPAKAGTPYIVGEEGPELFVPGASGTVVPNNQLQSSGGGMGGGTVINISAVDTQSFQSAIARDPEFIFNVSRAGARRTPGG
jgi:hypothetical protein